MYKRYQVLLQDWLEEYIKFGAEKYKLSISEIIRLQVCFTVIATTCALDPDYKPGWSCEEVLETVKEFASTGVNKYNREELNRLVSKIYFETRKAIEHRSVQAPDKQ